VSDWLEPLRAALDGAPAPVPFFFRDDDAGWRDDRLVRLIDIFDRCALPLDLAVIPSALTPELANELRTRSEAKPRLGLHQHGFAHRNHEPEGRKCEFGPSRARADQLRDIAEGRRRLEELLGANLDPIFTPPWNRCTRVTAECLVELGIDVLSRESGAEPFGMAGLTELPIGVDWFKQRKQVRLSREEVGELLASHTRAAAPVGVMFHHAVMEEDDWHGVDELLVLLAGHPRVVARPMIQSTSVGGSSATSSMR